MGDFYMQPAKYTVYTHAIKPTIALVAVGFFFLGKK